MNTCKDCKHWKSHVDSPSLGRCLGIPGSNLVDMFSSSWIGHSGPVTVMTHLDFGCRLWEANAEKKEEE